MRIHIFVLHVLILGQFHPWDFRENIVRNSRCHHEVNAGPRRSTQHQLIQLRLHTLRSDTRNFSSHVPHGLLYAGSHLKTQLGDKTRCAQHPKGVIVKRQLWRIRRV